MYCEKCGNKNETYAEHCLNCGNKLSTGLTNTNTEINQKEKITIGWGILGFVIPIVGLILFLSFEKSKPKVSKSAGIGALISAILFLVFIVFPLSKSSIEIFMESKDFIDYESEVYKYYEEEKEPISKTVQPDETFEFSNYQITVGSDYSIKYIYTNFKKTDKRVIQLPITIKRMDNGKGHFNENYLNVDNPDKSNSYIYLYLRNSFYKQYYLKNKTYTKYIYIEFEDDGVYELNFNNYNQDIKIYVDIKQ